jgi:hypothetical protein
MRPEEKYTGQTVKKEQADMSWFEGSEFGLKTFLKFLKRTKGVTVKSIELKKEGVWHLDIGDVQDVELGKNSVLRTELIDNAGKHVVKLQELTRAVDGNLILRSKAEIHIPTATLQQVVKALQNTAKLAERLESYQERNKNTVLYQDMLTATPTV